MKKILIVESPGKIKTISKFLGSDFKVMSTVGHIKDLPSKELGIAITDKSIDITYITLENKDKVINDIVKASKNADAVFLAPDPDREGEIIAWHVAQEVKKVISEDKIHRITFNEITKSAILDAIQHPTTINLPKVAAQQARRVLDRWVGYEVSPILWKKLAKGLSAGRVQSVALKLVCQRELEIRAFKIEEFWTIDGIFVDHDIPFTAQLTQLNNKNVKIGNEDEAKKILEKISQDTYAVASIVDKQRTKNPIAPFITSSLQQAAANKLGFAVKRTMSLAQNMYEGVTLEDPKSPVALITYMRTDSTRMSQTAIASARAFIERTWGSDYLPAKQNVFGKKENTQDAHEAIRPIDMNLKPDDIKPFVAADIYKLYSLIWSRAIASQMKPALYAQRQVVIGSDKASFKATGSTLLFDGFLKAYMIEEDEEEEKAVKLPNTLKEHAKVGLEKLNPKQHFTQPPSRYSEASLVKELEKQGIGRPSTYATILNTIQNRNYVSVEKKRFTPTDLGMKVTEMLEQNFTKIMNPQFTANMELDLDKIAQAELERDTLLRSFWQDFSQDLEKFKTQSTAGGKRTVETTTIVCPKCEEKNLVIRIGKNGSFAGCSGFPKCNYTSKIARADDGSITLVQSDEQPSTLLDKQCPQCKKQLRTMKGKFGEFIACSGYPECKYIQQNVANFACPNCKGEVKERKWKGGTLWGCSNYPKCTFSIFSDIDQNPCPACHNSPYMIKKVDKNGTITLICPQESCKKIIVKNNEQ